MGRKRLYRSRRERIIAGVAGGLADYFDVDVSVIRILWILTFSFGGGLAYLIACFIIPEQPLSLDDSENQYNNNWDIMEGPENPKDQEQRWRRGGIILIVLGFVFLLRALLPWPNFRDFLPFILIILGLIILFGGFKHNG